MIGDISNLRRRFLSSFGSNPFGPLTITFVSYAGLPCAAALGRDRRRQESRGRGRCPFRTLPDRRQTSSGVRLQPCLKLMVLHVLYCNCCTFLSQECHHNSSNSISPRPPGWLPRPGPRTTGATPLRRSILPSTATSTTDRHTAPRPLTRATIPLLITSRTGALLRPTIGATTTIPTGKCKGFSRCDQCTRIVSFMS